ncbi:MAG: hypothetical protein A4S17_00730 [Proteobacteria bacterium HN_bin10]|nr:MAG: hypothetical protein A4S17_00730 [Proteobacteria bacterium HN_bin10]
MIVFVIAAAGAAIFGFCRPRGVLRYAGLALLAAIVLPFVLGYGLAPFVGEGAGMGIAFILYALSAMIATLAVFSALGAGLRHGWNALR